MVTTQDTSSGAIVTEMEKFIGDAYVLGGEGPKTFDCSGLVKYSLEQLGYKNVPRTSEEQWGWVKKISKADLQPGDLVFAQFPGDDASPGHVGVYVGNGNVLSAQDPSLGIGYSSLASWGSAVVGYGRVPGSASGGASDASNGGSIAALAGDATTFLGELNDFVTIAHDLTQPSFWLRIGAFFMGIFFLVFGIYALAKAADPDISAPPIPIPVPV